MDGEKSFNLQLGFKKPKILPEISILWMFAGLSCLYMFTLDVTKLILLYQKVANYLKALDQSYVVLKVLVTTTMNNFIILRCTEILSFWLKRIWGVEVSHSKYKSIISNKSWIPWLNSSTSNDIVRLIV